MLFFFFFFFSSRRRHTRWPRDWSSDVCSSDLLHVIRAEALEPAGGGQSRVGDQAVEIPGAFQELLRGAGFRQVRNGGLVPPCATGQGAREPLALLGLAGAQNERPPRSRQ